MKYDADTADKAGIAGAEFKLMWHAESDYNVHYAWTEVGTFTTGDDGTLTLPLSKKGVYQLIEVSNPGYDVTNENSLIATFTIENADQGETFDLTDADDQTTIDLAVSRGTIDANGVPNDRLTGTATMKKAGLNGAALDGATFTLQVQQGMGERATWKDVVTGLKTGMSYALNADNSGLDGQGTSGTAGQISVSGLLWGTYRFVETASVDGYLPPADPAGATPTATDAFTIGRDSLTANLTGTPMTNGPTSVVIQKVDGDEQPLAGAEFTITPQAGSTFADGTTGARQLTANAAGTEFSLTAQLVVGDTYTSRRRPRRGLCGHPWRAGRGGPGRRLA